jgi:hypothetical protein
MAIYGTAFVIELKRVVKSSCVPQAIAELISADAKTDDANRIILLLTDLNDDWRFFWFEDKRVMILPMKKPKNAFDFIVHVLSQYHVDVIKAPGLEAPVKRVKLSNICPPIVDGALVEQYENLEMMKEDFADDKEEQYDIERQQHEIVHRLLRDNPIFHSMYS